MGSEEPCEICRAECRKVARRRSRKPGQICARSRNNVSQESWKVASQTRVPDHPPEPSVAARSRFHRSSNPPRAAGRRPDHQCGAGAPGRHFGPALPAPHPVARGGRLHRGLSRLARRELSATRSPSSRWSISAVRPIPTSRRSRTSCELSRWCGECWMLSGEIDFILKCVAPDLKTLQMLVTALTAAPHVRNVRTSLALRNSKMRRWCRSRSLGVGDSCHRARGQGNENRIALAYSCCFCAASRKPASPRGKTAPANAAIRPASCRRTRATTAGNWPRKPRSPRR